MIDDSLSKKDLRAPLQLQNLLISDQRGYTRNLIGNDVRPTRAEVERAVANIRAWRSYLPAACVAKMIHDGWQWST